jgi:hypothetical protein
MFGWYSEEQKELTGTLMAMLVNGDTVEITHQSNSPTESGTQWDDIQCLGELDRNAAILPGKPGPLKLFSYTRERYQDYGPPRFEEGPAWYGKGKDKP